jgi:hypothetical protein
MTEKLLSFRLETSLSNETFKASERCQFTTCLKWLCGHESLSGRALAMLDDDGHDQLV